MTQPIMEEKAELYQSLKYDIHGYFFCLFDDSLFLNLSLILNSLTHSGQLKRNQLSCDLRHDSCCRFKGIFSVEIECGFAPDLLRLRRQFPFVLAGG